ncbi:MAG: DUF6873 family GME fold protein [Thermotaleaceae bacterium]
MPQISFPNPFIPNKKVSSVIVDRRISLETMNNLRHMGIHIIKTPYCKDLYPQIAAHPDILLHPITDKEIVVAPNVYDYFKKHLSVLGYKAIRGEKVLSRNYPENIAYNVGRISRFAVHHIKYTDRVLVRCLEEKGVTFVHLNQGYSKCSICVISENAVITADRGIAKAVEKLGVDVLLISPGYIILPEMEYGFIGGATGLIDKSELAFIGDLAEHPDKKRILDFLISYDVRPIFLEKGKLKDHGSIIPLF